MKKALFFAALTAASCVNSPVFAAAYQNEINQIVNKIELPKIPDVSLDIKKFGAIANDGKNDLDAIQNAIDTLSRQGGGKIVIPAGTWYCEGTVHLRSKINLHLSQGAQLLFSTNTEHYLPVVKTRWEGTEMYGYSPLVYAANVEDVAITGTGLIDGNLQSEFHPWYDKQQPDMQTIRKMGIAGIPVEQRQFGLGTFLRPSLIQFFGAKRILLEGYTSKNSPFWVNHIVYAEHVTIRDIKVDSHFPNNDGVDLDSVKYAVVENSHFRTGDDAVVIKSGRDKDGRDIAKPSQYIVVRNNDMGGEDGIGLGSEMSGGISHVYFVDNVLRKGKAAIRFKGSLDRGGLVEHIRVANLKIEEFDEVFWFQLNYPGVIQGGLPSIYRDIIFENIQVEKAKVVLEAHAYKDEPLSNVVFKNVTVNQAETPFVLDNVTDLKLQALIINGQRMDGNLSSISQE
ncbi:glycoside hydrolase family 28 protein [Catenovulum agarivorans]|uniref:glycoside hydrolase family 28 protein n=1 Tax=Catenovulum agarivorans TaxID=1172192 RepID=UPI0002F63AF2|nr:glycoside hydrolase family 28 protein [Catenovulum agarivorans]